MMSPPRVLIVEDELIIAEDMKRRLEKLGYDVDDVVLSGKELFERIRKGRPDVILMDIHLGGDADGVDLAAKLREAEDIPVIFVTAYADEATVERAKESAPFGYVIKPVKDGDLRSSVEIALYKHAMEKRLRDSEERFHDLFIHTFAGVLVLEPGTAGFVVKDLNPAALTLEGMSENARGKCVEECLEDAASPELLSLLDRVWRKGVSETITLSRYRDGEIVSWREYHAYHAALGEMGLVIRDVTERKRTEEMLRRRTHDLEQRVRVEDCLAEVLSVLAEDILPFPRKLEKIVRLLPRGVHFSEEAGVRIVLGREQFRTENFFATLWGVSRPLLVRGRQVGSLEIHALAEKPPLYEGPLLREEVALLDRAAEYLAWAVRTEENKKRFSREMEYLQATLNASEVPQLVVDRNGAAVYLNNAFEAATGLSLEELRFRDIWDAVRVRSALEPSCSTEGVRKSFRNVCETGAAEELPDAFSLFPCRGDGRCRVLRMAPLWGMEQEMLGVLFSLVFPGANDVRFSGGRSS